MIYNQISPLIFDCIKNAKNILLISHENPDGDTLGAALALANYLKSENINHQLYCQDKPAIYFNFLPRIEEIITDCDNLILENYDLAIAIDCGDFKRTGLANDLIKAKDKIKIINIDHHQSNDLYGDLNLVMTNASSTCEIVYNFFMVNKLKIDKYIATNLLTGILTDTMNFTNASTSQESLEVASDLIKKGARLNQIIAKISQNKDLNLIKLWGELLSRIQYNNELNFAYTIITKQDFQDYQIPPDGIDGLANFLSNLQDVNFILVLSEEENNFIKGSLRTTKDDFDVSRIAKSFGGGGHKKAAGFKIEIPQNTQDWKNLVLNDIINQLTKLKKLNPAQFTSPA